MLKKNYKIEIGMTPNDHDHPMKPYYWMIMSNIGDDWCNEFFSWESSPEEAWIKAREHYNTFMSATKK